MNRKVRFLIISIVIVVGIVLGINFVSNASIFDNAFGEEVIEIKERMGVSFNILTNNPTTIKNNLNTDLTNANTNLYTGKQIENNIIKPNYYTLPNIFCAKHQMTLKDYNGIRKGGVDKGPLMVVQHGTDSNNMNDRINFTKDTPLTTAPTLKRATTIFKTAYDDTTNGQCSCKNSPIYTYSNYNAIQYWSGKLENYNVGIGEEYLTVYGAPSKPYYRIPYIMSFYEPTGSFHTNPSEAQKALWAHLGRVTGDCELNDGCTTFEELELYRAALAVERYINYEKSKGTEPTVTVPNGAQAGAAYFSYGSETNFQDVIQNMEVGLKEELETQKIISDGIVRIGPFQMSNYAYAFSEEVAKYSNKNFTTEEQYPHVLAGIVAGEVVIDGTAVPIVSREEAEEYIYSSGGTVISGKAGASIVYKDWYNQVPAVYEIENDVRGDASRKYTRTLNGKSYDLLYSPKIDDSDGADCGVYHTGLTEKGSHILYSPGEAAATSDKLKVKIKDANGDYTVNYPFPLPNSIFYIEIPISQCGTAESILTDINFTYRDITTTGTGAGIVTRAARSKMEFNTGLYTGTSDSTTYVDSLLTPCLTSRVYGCVGGSHSKHEHSGCGCKITKCGHSCNNDCASRSTCPGGVNHVCDSGCVEEYCGHPSGCNSCYKECWGDHTCCHDHTCGDPITGGFGTYTGSSTTASYATCPHGHKDCKHAYWKVTEVKTVYGQPLLIPTSGKTEVVENKVPSTINMKVLERINTQMEIVCVWHGWDTVENRGSSVRDMVNDEGFFDDDKNINWGRNAIKAAELGDRIVYRVTVSHTAQDVNLYIWLRIKYAENMVADEITTPEVYRNGPNEFYGEKYSNKYGGYFWTVGEGGSMNPKYMTVDGAPRTVSAELYVKPGSGFTFFFEYTLVKEINATRTNSLGKVVANTPTVQITSLDYKYKNHDDPHLGDRNVEFVRTTDSGGKYRGPVITSIYQDDQPLIVKRYVINLNKYIYDVQHKHSAVTAVNTTIPAGRTRGYEFANGTTNLYSVDDLPKVYQDTEDLKKQNPVYVEYGDRITYKIEIGNGKVSNRDTVEDFDYDVDTIYVTLVDELPMKYSDLQVSIENANLQGAHLKKSYPNPNSDTGGTITLTDLMVPKNGVTVVTVSFVIEEHEKNTKHENKAFVKDRIVYNYNRGPNAEPWTDRTCDVSGFTYNIGASSDWYVINDYEIDMKKYISSYTSDVHKFNEIQDFTLETPKIDEKTISGDVGTAQKTNEDIDRKDMKENVKENEPVPVEKTDILMYSIKMENLSKNITHGHQKATDYGTQVRVSKIREKLHSGLEYQNEVHAFIYGSNGNVKRNVTQFVTTVDKGSNTYDFELAHHINTLLDPGDFLVYYVKVKVIESNMSLEKLNNDAEIISLTNINAPLSNSSNPSNPNSDEEDGRFVQTEPGVHTEIYNENVANQQKSSEYVKMKDLVIAGKVWLDLDRNGQMDDGDMDPQILSEKDYERFLINSAGPGKADVEVKLYSTKDPQNPVRTTTTDLNGMYTFSRKDGHTNSYYENSFKASGEDYDPSVKYQRVDKADNKDQYGNYIVGTSQYIDYYVEFEYDGILYKSTEVYSKGVYPPAEDNGMTNLTGNGNYNDLYETDSNAFEKKTERERFNKLYEYISFNSAFDMSKSNPQELEFEKENHISLLNEDKTRVVRARSFINNKNDDDNYLWLYKDAGVGGAETEYLKYINLGLELREEVDISLTKDVYKVKTTVNGETMEYDFNQNNALNGASTGLGGSQRATNPYLQDFIIKKPYGLELYEFDYKFRVDQYFAEEVRNYKGSASELNVEVTYRITIDNKPISDADDVLAAGKTVTKTPLFVRVNEIMDLYEVNFIELGEKLNDEITVKIKQEDGTLRDEIIKTVEAWYFVEDTNGTYIVENDKAVQNGAKPIYKEVNPADVPAATTKYARKDLTIDANSISDDSKFTDNQIDYKDYGYNKLFIRGMDDIAIGEDKSLDVYVKYILDKGEEQFELNQESINAYEETSKEATVEYNSAVLGDAYGSYTHTIERQGRTNLFTIQRTLKIKDPTLLDGMTMERTNNRGLEGIAQINAYSVWYSEDLTKPASLVDRNSNVGNIGAEGESPDDYTQYDDTVYKTGIVISVEQTATDKNNGSELSQFGALEVIGTPKLQRVINGTVWDDARSVEINEEYSSAPGAPKQIINKQYVGNGIYSADPSDLDNRKQSGAIANENVAEIYKRANGDAVTENNDFPIRNVKAEFIEIVKKEDASSPTGYRYYEQHLQQVTWPYQQWDRTDDSGYYELKGFVPGTYIIRFTYGDNVNTDGTFDHTSADQRDMLIFNGHDYKSTQFNKDLETIHGKDADKIMEILEAQGVSDAIDDEIRRLEVNSYSEVMTNPKAEILKGTANGVLTTREEESTRVELEALIENTTMQAETVEFLVKAEKLTTDQINKRKMTNTVLNPKYELYSQLKSVQELERNERKFTIAQIDFGLEYRPEAEIRLVKEIEEVKVITEDKNVLVDLFFYTENKGTDTVHKIDKNKSKGLELVQFVSNEYHVLLKDLTNEDKQGFVFVQVDEEILQGSTIDITYKFEAENNSEIDRIAVDLERIRYKENEEAKSLLGTYDTANELAKANYTASGIAAKVIKEDIYKEDTQGVEYRTRQKTLVNKNDASMPFDAKLAKEKLDSYYGRFVGYAYYTGDVTKLDTVASLKFDKILDFVDVNIEYIQQSEQASTADKFWIRTKSTDLKDHIYQLRTGKVNVLENGRGYSYDENLVVSVDDRIKDDKYSTRYSTYKVDEEVDSNIRNNDLSRFLLPQSTVLSEAERDKSVGTVRLNVSKVLSAEADKKDMSYENLAEVIQFTTLTGRRTDFGTTIGNSDVMATALSGGDEGKGSLEFVTASFESDTAATETITLIPPTGLMRNRRAIVNVVEATTVGVGIVFVLGTIAVILIMIITMVLFVIRKYKKRRIV